MSVDNPKARIDEILLGLTPCEQEVIQLRFGLEDGITHTLEQVGDKFDRSRERIRQIEGKALRKLRHPSRSRNLRDSFDSRYLLSKEYRNLLAVIIRNRQESYESSRTSSAR